MAKSSLVRELWAYMRVRKKWWLLPVILLMVAVGMLVAGLRGRR